MTRIVPKSKVEIEIMDEGGKKLGEIKKRLEEEIKIGNDAKQIEELADKLISQTGGKPSFKMVPRYSWATCINVNDGVVHGIPKKKIIFKKGDVVSVDVGLYYKGFHTDTSFTVGLDINSNVKKFLTTGEKTLYKAIKKAKTGGRIFDISKAMQDGVEEKGYSVIKALVGHGIGKKLHEEPHIPCFVEGKRSDSPKIPDGATFAIEIMYTTGDPSVHVEPDGWTISTRNGKIAALFEETVAVRKNGPLVLTKSI